MSFKSPLKSINLDYVVCATVCGLAGLSLYASESYYGATALMGYLLAFIGFMMLAGTIIYTVIKIIDCLISIGVGAFIDSITNHLK
jgi:hypothetical protein